MSSSRRELLQWSLGAAQVALLSRVGVLGSTALAADADAPTRLITLHIAGGYRPQFQWWPLTEKELAVAMPPPGRSEDEPLFFDASALMQLAEGDGTYTPLQTFRSQQQSWKRFALHEQTSVLHGIDQGTEGHASGVIASMSGVPGLRSCAPTIHSVVANALHARFASRRPLPVVTVDGGGRLVTAEHSEQSLALAAHHEWWAHTPHPWHRFNARVEGGPGAFHDELRTVSRALADDVATMLAKVTPVEHLMGVQRAGTLAYAVSGRVHAGLQAPLEMALRLAKCDAATAIHVQLTSPSFDTHDDVSGVAHSAVHGRGVFDVIARFCGELKATPAPGRPGKTLLDDTLVMVFSELGRTWPTQVSNDGELRWNLADDHHRYTSVTYIGGNVAPNRSVGSYLLPGAAGVDVDLLTSRHQHERRAPRAADAVATALRIMGLDFSQIRIPGGSGEVTGVRRG